MVTYLVGTDGVSASESLCDYFEQNLDEDDHLEVVTVKERSDPDDYAAGKKALETFEERYDGLASISTELVYRGRSPADELPVLADEIDADRIVIGLRRHSRTERIIFGSVAHVLLQRVTRPIILVPLPEYQTPAE